MKYTFLLFSFDKFSSALSLAVKTHPLWKTACRTRSLYVAKSRAPFDGGGSRSVSRSHLASMAVPGPFPTPFNFPWLPWVSIAVGTRVSDGYTDTHPSAATTHAQCGCSLGVAGADGELHGYMVYLPD